MNKTKIDKTKKVKLQIYVLALLFLLSSLIVTTKFYLFFPYRLLATQLLLFTIILINFFRKELISVKQFSSSDILILVFIIWSCINSYFSDFWLQSIKVLNYQITAVLAYFVISRLNVNKKERLILAYGIVLSFVISIIPGFIFQYIRSENFSRLSLTWVNANYYASYLLVTFGFIYYLSKISHKRKLFLASIGLLVILLLWTQSRGGILTFFIIVVILVILENKKLNKKWLIYGSVLAFLIIVGIIIAFIAIRPATIFFRERIYRTVFSYLKEFGLIGTGVGSFMHIYPNFRLSDYRLISQEDIITHAHNEFLEIWAETGIVGVILFIAFVLSIILIALRKIRTYSGEKRLFLISCFLAFLGLLIHNLFTISLRMSAIFVYLFIMAGLIKQENREFKISNKKIRNKTGNLRWIVAGLLILILIFFNIKHVKGLNYYQKAKRIGLSNSHKISQAKIYCKKAAEYIPANTGLRYYQGILNVYSKNYKKADEYFSKLLNMSPYYPQAHFWKGYIYSLEQDWNKAIKEYKTEIEFNQYPKVYFNLAIVYQSNNEINKAAEIFGLFLDKILEKISKNTLYSKSEIIAEEKERIEYSLKRLKEIFSSNQKKLRKIKQKEKELVVN